MRSTPVVLLGERETNKRLFKKEGATGGDVRAGVMKRDPKFTPDVTSCVLHQSYDIQ